VQAYVIHPRCLRVDHYLQYFCYFPVSCPADVVSYLFFYGGAEPKGIYPGFHLCTRKSIIYARFCHVGLVTFKTRLNNCNPAIICVWIFCKKNQLLPRYFYYYCYMVFPSASSSFDVTYVTCYTVVSVALEDRVFHW
jgi:hypothetical protein